MASDKTSRALNSIKQHNPVIAPNFELPNNSGDHQRSIKRNDPINNEDLVNKDYPDHLPLIKYKEEFSIQADTSNALLAAINGGTGNQNVFTGGYIVVSGNSHATAGGDTFINSGISGDVIISKGATNKILINGTGIDFKGNPLTGITNITITGDILFSGDAAGLLYGEISVQDNSTETTISTAGTAVQVTIFDTNGENNGTTPDHTNDHITIDTAGRYLLMCSATVNSIAGAASKFTISIQKNNGTTELVHVERNVGGGGTESGVIAMQCIKDLAASDTIEIWIENQTNTQNYLVEDIIFSLTMLGGT